jgi:hypothetical protein
MGIILALFGCRHARLTFPLTPMTPRRGRTYVACLGCGKQFEYEVGSGRGRELRHIAEPVREFAKLEEM